MNILEDMMASPKRRIKRQRSANITVVIGNPPYSAGQKSANEDNRNISHPELESRMKNTYHQDGPKRQQKTVCIIHTSKAFRWASDRIGNSGVIGFVYTVKLDKREHLKQVSELAYKRSLPTFGALIWAVM